jgi:hypothetical protein
MKLYDFIVWPVIGYGAAIWGVRTYSCINAVQNRAARLYLGVRKCTPDAAVKGDKEWRPLYVRHMKAVSRHWCNTVIMVTSREMAYKISMILLFPLQFAVYGCH